MLKVVRFLVMMAVIWISGGASAQPPICRSAAAESLTNYLIEEAGALEKSLLQVLGETKSPSAAREASQKLAVLEQYVESLLDINRRDSLIEIQERLKQLSIFQGEVPKLPESVVQAKSPYHLQVVMHRRAEKDFADLPHYIRAKFLEFMNEASGLVSITLLSPSWALERVNVREITSDLSYSVRLNRGHRVFFTVTAGDKALMAGKQITVYRISTKVTHE